MAVGSITTPITAPSYRWRLHRWMYIRCDNQRIGSACHYDASLDYSYHRNDNAYRLGVGEINSL